MKFLHQQASLFQKVGCLFCILVFFSGCSILEWDKEPRAYDPVGNPITASTAYSTY